MPSPLFKKSAIPAIPVLKRLLTEAERGSLEMSFRNHERIS